MKRRDLLRYAAVLVPVLKSAIAGAEQKQPEIAFTFDDPKTDEGAGLSWQDINHRILGALAKHGIKAVLFVTGKRVDGEQGRELITAWDKDGHAIANHSYSHLFFNDDSVTLAQFESDFLRDEPLVREYPHFTRLFRFPFFKEGDTAEKRDAMRSFLLQHQYRVGRATIDASDWVISQRLEKRAAATPKSRPFLLRRVLQAAHLGARTMLRFTCSPGTQSQRPPYRCVAPQCAQCVVPGSADPNVH